MDMEAFIAPYYEPLNLGSGKMVKEKIFMIKRLFPQRDIYLFYNLLIKIRKFYNITIKKHN